MLVDHNRTSLICNLLDLQQLTARFILLEMEINQSLEVMLKGNVMGLLLLDRNGLTKDNALRAGLNMRLTRGGAAFGSMD